MKLLWILAVAASLTACSKASMHGNQSTKPVDGSDLNALEGSEISFAVGEQADEGLSLTDTSGRYDETAYALQVDLKCGDETQVIELTKEEQKTIVYRDLTDCSVHLKKFAVERGEARPIEPLIYEPNGRKSQGAEIFKSIDQGSVVDTKLVVSDIEMKRLCTYESDCDFREVDVLFTFSEFVRTEVPLEGDLHVSKWEFRFEKELAPDCDVLANFDQTGAEPVLVINMNDCTNLFDNGLLELAFLPKRWQDIYTPELLHLFIDEADIEKDATNNIEIRLTVEDLMEIGGTTDVFDALSMDIVLASRNKGGRSIHYYVIDNSCEPWDLIENINNKINNNPHQSWTAAYPAPGKVAYFGISDLVYGSDIFPGWCLDTNRILTPGREYEGRTISSYELDLVARLGLMVKPQNLPKVNWIINQQFVNTEAPGDLGTFTFGDVQAATWDLIGDPRAGGLGPHSEARITYIKAQAELHPKYTPDKDGLVGVILVPMEGNHLTTQTLIAEIPISSLVECCEI